MSAIRTATWASSRSLLIGALAGAFALITLFSATASAKPGVVSGKQVQKPTIVLVHGAFADATGWSGVIKRLQADGYPVIAPARRDQRLPRVDDLPPRCCDRPDREGRQGNELTTTRSDRRLCLQAGVDAGSASASLADR